MADTKNSYVILTFIIGHVYTRQEQLKTRCSPPGWLGMGGLSTAGQNALPTDSVWPQASRPSGGQSTQLAAPKSGHSVSSKFQQQADEAACPEVPGGQTERDRGFGRLDSTRRDALRHVPPRSLRSKPPDCWHKLGRSCLSSPLPAPERGAAAGETPRKEAALPAARRTGERPAVPAVGPRSPHGRARAPDRGRRAVLPPPLIPSARPPSSTGRARRPAAAWPAAGPGAGGRRRPRHGGPDPRQALAGRGAHLHPARRRLAAGRRRRGGGQQRHAGGGPPGTGNGAAAAAAAAAGRSGPGLGRRGGRGSGRWGREEEATGAGRAAQGPRGGAETPGRWRGAPGGPCGAAAAPGDASGAPILGREKSPPWLIAVNYRERRLTGCTWGAGRPAKGLRRSQAGWGSDSGVGVTGPRAEREPVGA